MKIRIFVCITISFFMVDFCQSQSMNVLIKVINNLHEPVRDAEIEFVDNGNMPISLSSTYSDGMLTIENLNVGFELNVFISHKDYQRVDTTFTVSQESSRNRRVINLGGNLNISNKELNGTVYSTEDNQPIQGVSIKVWPFSYRDKMLYETVSDMDGSFVIPYLSINQKIKVEISHKCYMTESRNEKINEEDDKNIIQIRMQKKKTHLLQYPKMYPYSTSTVITGLGVTITGVVIFNKGRKIHDDYEANLTYEDFVKVRKGYDSREEAYEDAERLRKTSSWMIPLGIGLISVSQLWLRKIDKKKLKNTTCLIDDWRLEVSPVGAGLFVYF